MKGEVVYSFIFDIGASVDLAELRRRVDMDFLSGRAPSERAAPRYAQLPEPLLVTLDRRNLETNLGPLTVDIAARLYDVGSLAVMFRTPFEVSSLQDLVPYGGLRIVQDGREESLEEYGGRIAARIEEDVVPYMRGTYEVRAAPEPYRVYCVTEGDVPAQAYAESRRQDVAALLGSETRPQDLSDTEVNDAWKNWLSYYKEDLLVIDWDAAFVVEPTGKYEDTLAVIELANVQLLELRSYDSFLDRVNEKAYDDLDDLFARSGVLRSGRDMVKQLADVRMDLAELRDKVENISKFFGDWYLGKVYLGCALKFELDSWRRIVNEKMQVLSEIYHVAQAEVTNRRMLLLEALIVLLFVVDLVLILYIG